MENATGQGAKSARKVVFHRVAENLYRLENTGGYYALVKRGDKQFRRSLKTKDRKLAERRLDEYRAQVGNLTISEDGSPAPLSCAALNFSPLNRKRISNSLTHTGGGTKSAGISVPIAHKTS
ncbi:hypothetical protein [Opitutus sp. GAS368]|uniref:hypothetical protein n=1 Tax=Opitutus sp. GAS368 TaxID=1882749 RepID=UPI0012FE50DF|nr:hypothetical protein [Opitutus sp. GAS368]